MLNDNSSKIKIEKQSLSLTAFDSSLYTREPIFLQKIQQKYLLYNPFMGSK